MSLAGVAKQTLEILDRGEYTSPSGKTVEVGTLLAAARDGTVLYTPDRPPAAEGSGGGDPPQMLVTAESTGQAGRRLVQGEGLQHVVALNFASAKNPGGGFKGGAKAQEEDLARASGLYPCLLEARGYYEANRASDDLVYTDHLIYSPGVPFFRDHDRRLLEEAFPLSIITAPAPNAGEVLRRDPRARPRINAALENRSAAVLSVARAHGHRTLVLGAWGCGVFRNEPSKVASVFRRWLEHERFAGAFDLVVFAIYDRTRDRRVLDAFRDAFA